jgi:cation/acetate symporter
MMAFLIPVSWLAYKQMGTPLAPLAYGAQLTKIADLEQKLISDPSELAVRQEYLRRADALRSKLENVETSLRNERYMLEQHVRDLKLQNAEFSVITKARRDLQALPKSASEAQEVWHKEMLENYERSKPLGGMPLHGKPFQGEPDGTLQEQELFNHSSLLNSS